MIRVSNGKTNPGTLIGHDKDLLPCAHIMSAATEQAHLHLIESGVNQGQSRLWRAMRQNRGFKQIRARNLTRRPKRQGRIRAWDQLGPLAPSAKPFSHSVREALIAGGCEGEGVVILLKLCNTIKTLSQ